MRTIGKLRPSQIITTYGPGAIVELRNISIIIAGLDVWRPDEEKDLVDEPRLVRALGREALYKPAYREDEKGWPIGTIPAYIFPEYYVCPSLKCRRLAKYTEFDMQKQQKFTCKTCKYSIAFPSRFIVACPNGHIDDFPWLDYVHSGASGGCDGPLKLWETGVSGAISDIYVECEKCQKKRSLGPAFNTENGSPTGPCCSRRPWFGPENRDPKKCTQAQRTMLRGASNVYFPIVRSALSIPPWVDPLQMLISKYERDMAKLKTVQDMENYIRFTNKPELARFTSFQLFNELDRRRQRGVESGSTILYEEWEALRQRDPSSGKVHFEIDRVEVPAILNDWVEGLVQVKRLREVRAVLGFSRIDSLGEPGEDVSEPVKMVPLNSAPQNWLPAVETLGEGIFIEFKEKQIRTWEKSPKIGQIASKMETLYGGWRSEKGLKKIVFPGMRYMLLHSISHGLLRQLALECGYSASSLRERIYCSADTTKPMSGILIYTASVDSDGSLGGLVELGDTRRFGHLFANSLHEMAICSSDPLCAGHQPEVQMTLNGAACHACMMASETSCERGNRLLDRNLVVTTFAGSGFEFFSPKLYRGITNGK